MQHLTGSRLSNGTPQRLFFRQTIFIRWVSSLLAVVALLMLVLPQIAAAYNHPGGLYNQTQIDAAVQKVQANTQPWKGAYDRMITTANNYSSRTPVPTQDLFIPGYYTDPGGNATAVRNLHVDTWAAYSSAMAYKFTGNTAYANKSVQILKAWSTGNRTISTGGDTPLYMSYNGVAFILAGDLLLNYSATGWGSTEKTAFKNWVRNIYLPAVASISEHKDSNNRLHNWSDWGMFASMASYHLLDDSAGVYSEIDRLKRHVAAEISDTADSRGRSGYLIAEVDRGHSGIWYSYFSLAPLTAAAHLANNSTGTYLFGSDTVTGQKLKRALDYELYYLNNPGQWPWYQPNPSQPISSTNPSLYLPSSTNQWGYNLYEAMAWYYSDAGYTNYASPQRPIQVGDHHYAWTFPTLMKRS